MTIEVGAILEDAPQLDSAEAIAARILSRTKDAEEPSDHEDEDFLETTSDEDDVEDEDAEEPSESETEDENEGTEETDDTEESETPKQKKRVDDDDAVVTVRYNDEDVEVPVKDLKRLYGQEQALNRKSVELSESKKQADSDLRFAADSMSYLVEMAHNDYVRKYHDPETGQPVNLNVLAKRFDWSAEEYETIVKQEEKDRANLHFLMNGKETLKQQRDANDQAKRMSIAQVNRAAIFHPETGIKGITDERINEIGLWAVNEKGINPKVVQEFGYREGDDALLRLMDEFYESTRTKTVSTKALAEKARKPVNAAPKVLKTSSEPARKSVTPNAVTAAKQRLRKSGSIEDAVNLAMSRMPRRRDD